MNEIALSEESTTQRKVHPFFPLLGKVTFIIYFGFIFFGNTIPFKEKVSDVSDIITANPINQIVYSILFLLSLIALIPKYKDVVNILYKEKALSLFFLWSLVTIVWSQFPFIAFKRWFQVIIIITITLSVAIYGKDQKDILKLFKSFLIPYLIISLISVVLISGAKDEYGAWRGLTTSKNNLGQVSLINLIIWLLIFFYSNYKDKIIALIMIGISLILLIGSKSTTSQFAAVFIVLLIFLRLVDKIIERLKLGRLFTFLGLFTFFAIVIAVFLISPESLNSLANQAGKDLSFTGRTSLWNDILQEVNQHLFIGCGFQSFWIVDNNALLELYKVYVWFPNQAHNGYLDILNETGLIGLGIFLFAIVNYFFNILKLRKPNYYVWLVIAAIIINFQESTFIRPQLIIGTLFMFSYFTLFTELHKQSKREQKQEITKIQKLDSEFESSLSLNK